MTYVASALRRDDDGWAGSDLDLSDVDDLDTLTDELRGTDAATVVCLLEEDDEYVAIVRVDGDGDPRVFVSDRRVLDADGLAGRLLAEGLDAEDEPVEEDDDDEDSGRPEVEPAGDEALLADLGVSGDRLLAWCAAEGMLPSDVIFAVGEAIGAADVLENVRGV